MKNDQFGGKIEEKIWDNFNYLKVSNPNAYMLKIPNNCVSELLGQNGSNLISLKEKTNAHNLHIEVDSLPNEDYKWLFIEGSERCFKKIKNYVDDLLSRNELKMEIEGEVVSVRLKIPVKSLSLLVG